jgi:hypothetical protein
MRAARVLLVDYDIAAQQRRMRDCMREGRGRSRIVAIVSARRRSPGESHWTQPPFVPSTLERETSQG